MGRTFPKVAPLLVGLVLAVPSLAPAAEITLRSADLTVEMTGELLGYDGEFFRLKTRFGDMTLRAQGLICHGLACPDPGQYAADIAIAGSADAIRTTLPRLIEAYGFARGLTTLRTDHGDGWTIFVSDGANVPVARIQATAGTNATAFADLAAGRADIIFTTRHPTVPEVEATRANGGGDLRNPYRSRIVAVDGLAVIVNRRNPVRAIRLADLAGIYAGQITSWADLGGDPAPIRLLQRDAGTDLAQFFYDRVFPPEGDRVPMQAAAFETDDRIAAAVAADPFAIGFVALSGVGNARPLALTGACGIRVVPTRFALGADDYPMLWHLHAYTPERRLPVFARDVLAWLDSDEAADALERAGLVGLGIARMAFLEQPARVANAVRSADDEVSLQNLKGFVRGFAEATRLSTTFRFQDNSTEMDERSAANVARLARRIEDGDFDGRELVFAGFSDSTGGAAGNRRIARQRAEEVADLVRKAATRADMTRLQIRSLGLGEVSPLACNDDEAGRRLNRRVEVWLR
jgi:phosphate transport system substrate-binding protein